MKGGKRKEKRNLLNTILFDDLSGSRLTVLVRPTSMQPNAKKNHRANANGNQVPAPENLRKPPNASILHFRTDIFLPPSV